MFKLHGPTSILEYKKVKLRHKQFKNKMYGEILFKKVASGYFLHFVHDGSSKNVLEKKSVRATDVTKTKIKKNALYIPPSLPFKGPICPLEGPYLPLRRPWPAISTHRIVVPRVLRTSVRARSASARKDKRTDEHCCWQRDFHK